MTLPLLTTGIAGLARMDLRAVNVCYALPMTIILRLAAWGLAAAIAFATLGPAEQRPHSNLGQNGEHALAFVLLGMAFGLAYAGNRSRIAALVIGYTGLIELLQLIAPGRHARLQDFMVDALAACLGLVVAAAIDWMIRRARPRAS